MRLESETSLNTWGQGTVHKRGEEHAGRLEWVETTSVRTVAERVKGKIYELVMRLAMMCGLELVAQRKRQLEVFCGMDRIRNEYTGRHAYRGRAQVELFGEKVREVSLRRFGHVQRRNHEYIRMSKMELLGWGKEEDHRGN